MAVTLDSGLPFHLSRGDQERETSRLSLRHGRRFNDKRHSWTTDCHPLSSCGINKRRRVSDRTSLSSFFPSFSPFLSYYRIQGTYPRRQVISSCDNTTVLWSFLRLSEQRIPILVIEYKENGSIRFFFCFLFIFFYFFMEYKNDPEAWIFAEWNDERNVNVLWTMGNSLMIAATVFA